MDTRALERENKRLRRENQACREQERLFESLLEMIGSASEDKVLGHAMEQALGITARLVGARTGSLFLLDGSGRVTGSLLTRGEVAPELRSSLVGTVLTKGLAGWVRTRCRAGLIRDTLDDERWIDLPDEPYRVRSALALPIVKREVLFGILTLMHPEPGFFDEESVETAQMAADHMAVAIEGAQLYVRIEELNRIRRDALARDLDLARQVQLSFLPPGMPKIDGYEFAAVNRPALAVGGDFYYFYTLEGNRLGVAIGDVSGKGVAASLFMARLSSELQHYSREFDDPGRLLAHVNQELCARAKQGMFVTLVYMIMELSTGRCILSNAGHIPPLLQAGSRITPMDDEGFKGPPLGILPDAAYGRCEFCLREDQRMLLCTDGVLEARNAAGELYGFDQLVRNILVEADSGPDDMVRGLVRTVDEFTGGRGARDDLTLVCIRRTAPGRSPG